MSWELLPTNFTDAVWLGLKRYNQINNEDGSVSFDDITEYINLENSFFGSVHANRMNEAMNIIMSMVENGTDLYEAFQNYFAWQKTLFEIAANATQAGFITYVAGLKVEGDNIILTLKTEYKNEMNSFQVQQQQLFLSWFQTIQDQLSEDIAGSLQNQIIESNQRLSALEQMVLQNDFTIPLATDDTEITLLVDDSGHVFVDEWKYLVATDNATASINLDLR